MASYNNEYAAKITPNIPNLRGISTNYSNDGRTDLGGVGLGDLYDLTYDRQQIENIFNQGTDAQYALKQKENQIAENQYANNQFANQQSTIEALRANRNAQISSGMARGLNAAQEQGTVLGLQQESSAGALELANNRQKASDEIAAAYAENMINAMKESNAVKQAMAGIAATLYESDMLGYQGELSYLGQMDANASDRYGYDVGLEGTKYTADKNYDGTVYKADRDLEGTKYSADKNYAATIGAANISASAQRAAAKIAASSGNSTNETITLIDRAIADAKSRGITSGNELVDQVQNYLVTNDDSYRARDSAVLWNDLDQYMVNQGLKDQTKATWEAEQSTNNSKKQSTNNSKNIQSALSTMPSTSNISYSDMFPLARGYSDFPKFFNKS